MELKIRTMILKSINDTKNISVITLTVMLKNVEHSNCLAIVNTRTWHFFQYAGIPLIWFTKKTLPIWGQMYYNFFVARKYIYRHFFHSHIDLIT